MICATSPYDLRRNASYDLHDLRRNAPSLVDSGAIKQVYLDFYNAA
jgi:hypothetical protein